MKKKNTLVDLKKLLQQKSVVFGVSPSMHELIAFLEKAKQEKRVVRLMYGETYDMHGITIDSLKYYLFLSQLHKGLEQMGILVASTVVVADSASVLNKSVTNKEELLIDGKRRVADISKIVEIYDLPIKTVLMSDLFKSKQVTNTIEKVRVYSQSSKSVQELFEKTVLQNKIAQEKEAGFQYAAEAVATSLQFDMKIGPPREQYYDKAADIVGEALGLGMVYGLYLKPTYPLGKDFSFFITNPEIEEFGITPYKAGSNKLQDFRIILGKTSQQAVKQLIQTSFISSDLSLANPVVDMNFIAYLARNALEKGSLSFYSKDLLKNSEEFKQKTCENLQRYIFTPLREGGFYE